LKQTEIGVGILFVTPYILQANISSAEANLSNHHQVLAAGLEDWCEQTKFQVLWARYVRAELLQESGCCEWVDGKISSCPGLDMLICTM
jgi:hypothetical protein